jgi:23S rRNA (guanosine2251-2'-O)-methyltransferase
MKDSKEYLAKRAFFDKILTIYGRNSVVEALRDDSLEIYKLHLSTSNQKAPVLDEIETLAKSRGVEVAYHDKKALSRISKNAKQDQGVALDIVLDSFIDEDEFINTHDRYRVLILDGVNNPQNIGMIIRSATAGNIDAIILSKSISISPLIIKASVGTLFRMPIIKSKNLLLSIEKFKSDGATTYTLSSHAKNSYLDENYSSKVLFVLGNESSGVTKEIDNICDKSIAIPMRRGVESLNVAVSASLLAFMPDSL